MRLIQQRTSHSCKYGNEGFCGYLREARPSDMIDVKPSRVAWAGQGGFLTMRVKKGTIIGCYGGETLCVWCFEERYDCTPAQYVIAVRKGFVCFGNTANTSGKDMLLDAASYRHTERYSFGNTRFINSIVNTRNQANVEFVFDGEEFTIVALEDLEAGEELYLDYVLDSVSKMTYVCCGNCF
jgi:hypothetical protein